MPFCTNCGKQLSDAARFCPGCGTPVSGTQPQDQDQRTQTFAGEIRKCPNCGEAISAFEAICHSCGHELRNVKASNAVQALTDAITKIEATRPPQPSGIPVSAPVTGNNRRGTSKSSIQEAPPPLVTPTDRSIANVIQNFAIPNNKEDIVEFIILAANSITANSLYPFSVAITSETLIARAWYSKFEQAYQKAKLSFSSDPAFETVKEIYNKKQAELQKRKKRQTVSRTIFLTVMISLFAIGLAVPFLVLLFA